MGLGVTDAPQHSTGINEIFRVGRKTSWFRISEYNGDFAIDDRGRDISVGFYKFIGDEYLEVDMELKRGKKVPIQF